MLLPCSRVLWNVGIQLQCCMVSQLRRPWIFTAMETTISHYNSELVSQYIIYENQKLGKNHIYQLVTSPQAYRNMFQMKETRLKCYLKIGIGFSPFCSKKTSLCCHMKIWYVLWNLKFSNSSPFWFLILEALCNICMLNANIFLLVNAEWIVTINKTINHTDTKINWNTSFSSNFKLMYIVSLFLLLVDIIAVFLLSITFTTAILMYQFAVNWFTYVNLKIVVLIFLLK
jgi:hypothetical protein